MRLDWLAGGARLPWFLLVLIVLAACPPANDDDTATDDDDATAADDDDATAADDDDDIGPTTGQLERCESISEPRTEVLFWRAEGDLMLAETWRSGGCETWTYRLCWDGMFAESFPVQVWLTIVDEGPPDPCEAEVQEAHEFNLAPLREAYAEAYGQETGEIIVHLGGVTDSWFF